MLAPSEDARDRENARCWASVRSRSREAAAVIPQNSDRHCAFWRKRGRRLPRQHVLAKASDCGVFAEEIPGVFREGIRGDLRQKG